MIRSMRGGRARWIGLGVAIGAAVLTQAHMNTASAASSGRLRVPDPQRARALALGFEPVLADYYWIQAIQVVGGHANPSETHGGLVGDLIELVTTLDPWVDHPYRFAGLWLTGSRDDVRRADALLEKGISYHPLDWRNRFYLGYNLFFYLEENARAADVLETAVPLEGAPDYLGPFAARLRVSGGDLSTALLFVRQMVHDAPDPATRSHYLETLDEIETERAARYLDRARIEFWNRHGRDIREPRELWEGPLRVIDRRPPAHPRRSGARWEIDASGEIVSSYYGSRYRVHVHPTDAQRRAQWRAEMERARKTDAKDAGSEEGRG